mgnify:CR=1 FL=1
MDGGGGEGRGGGGGWGEGGGGGKGLNVFLLGILFCWGKFRNRKICQHVNMSTHSSRSVQSTLAADHRHDSSVVRGLMSPIDHVFLVFG